jgi:RNA polymerase sigma-70 factor, ECF subfamily
MQAIVNNMQRQCGVPGLRDHNHSMHEHLSAVVDGYQRTVYRIALRLLRNEQDAEDALQDALLLAYRLLSQFTEQAKMSTWLTAIVRNSARTFIRRRRSRSTVSLHEMEPERMATAHDCFVDGRPGPEELYAIAERQQKLQSASQKLSHSVRSAFQLVVLNGFSIREAAQDLGVSKGTIKSRLFRARNQVLHRGTPARHLTGAAEMRTRALAKRKVETISEHRGTNSCEQILAATPDSRSGVHTAKHKSPDKTPDKMMLLGLTSLLLCILNFWAPAAWSQTSNSVFSTADPAGTVSVTDLRIPPRARQAYRRGMEQLLKNDPAGSLSEFDKAIERWPNFYEAYYERGIAELQLHHHDHALESFQRAIDLSGGRYAPASFGYALALAREGKPKDAEAIVRRGLEIASTADGHVVLSVVLIELHRLDEAEHSAREALLLGGRVSHQAHLTLASIHAEKGDYRAEAQDLQTYLKLEPTDPNKQNLLAILDAAHKLADSVAKSK